MTDDSLKKFVDSLGVDGHVNEATLRGDLQTLILSMLSGQKANPWLDLVLLFIFGESEHSHASSSETADRNAAEANAAEAQDPSHRAPSDLADLNVSDNGQLAAGATLRHLTRMLEGCPTCRGDEASCPECHGSGKPASVPPMAKTEELWAWVEPALNYMHMHITNPGVTPRP
jgi:hypothetical protein